MLLAISGPSTVGKDSNWVQMAESLGFAREVPFTTRAKRANEADGIDYHFTSVDQFQEMIKNNLLTEWDYTLGAYYGTSLSLKTRLEKAEDIVIQVLGRMAIRLKKSLPDVQTVMLLTSDQTTLEVRLRERGYKGKTLETRLAHSEEERVHAPLFDFIVPDADILPGKDILRTLHEIISTR